MSIEGRSEYQEIQHRASDRCYEGRQSCIRNGIRFGEGFGGGFGGSLEDDVGLGILQRLLGQCGVEQAQHAHSIPRTVCHEIASYIDVEVSGQSRLRTKKKEICKIKMFGTVICCRDQVYRAVVLGSALNRFSLHWLLSLSHC